jgi:hypothetical protein
VLTQNQPPGALGCALNQQTAGQIVLRSQTDEITFTGQAGSALRAEFDDCKVGIGPGTTALRAELPDQGALTRTARTTALSQLPVVTVRSLS